MCDLDELWHYRTNIVVVKVGNFYNNSESYSLFLL